MATAAILNLGNYAILMQHLRSMKGNRFSKLEMATAAIKNFRKYALLMQQLRSMSDSQHSHQIW